MKKNNKLFPRSDILHLARLQFLINKEKEFISKLKLHPIVSEAYRIYEKAGYYKKRSMYNKIVMKNVNTIYKIIAITDKTMTRTAGIEHWFKSGMKNPIEPGNITVVSGPTENTFEDTSLLLRNITDPVFGWVLGNPGFKI